MPTTSSMFTTCCVLFNAAIMKATIMEIFLPLWKFSRLFFYGGDISGLARVFDLKF